MQTIILYLLCVNVITFLTYGSDKRRAIKNRFRVPEKTLILMAVAGGSVGAWLGMQIFRHKTRKPVFQYGIPLIVICQVGIYSIFFMDIPSV